MQQEWGIGPDVSLWQPQVLSRSPRVELPDNHGQVDEISFINYGGGGREKSSLRPLPAKVLWSFDLSPFIQEGT